MGGFARKREVWRKNGLCDYIHRYGLDQYGNSPEIIKAHIRLFVSEMHNLNQEIFELEKQLKSLLK